MAELRLLALYPDQMNIYADRGNVLFIQRRCEWRGIGFAYASAGIGETFDPEGHDLIYIGGGQDRDQRMVAADLTATKRGAIEAAVTAGVAGLAVCGGYQLLGSSYQLGEERIEGLAVAPGRPPYALAPDVAPGPVRQHLDIERVAADSGLRLQPVFVQETSAAPDGLVRVWERPAAGVNTHRAYAVQWYGLGSLTTT